MIRRVAVGMSGGVDSSLSAYLLKQQGYQVTGVFMRNWDFTDELGQAQCPATQDWKDVQAVCELLKIPCIEVFFRRAFAIGLFISFVLCVVEFCPGILE